MSHQIIKEQKISKEKSHRHHHHHKDKENWNDNKESDYHMILIGNDIIMS